MPHPPSSITILHEHLMSSAAVCCGAQQGCACSAAAEDTASRAERAPTGPVFAWSWCCCKDGLMAEVQEVFWGKDGAALRQAGRHGQRKA